MYSRRDQITSVAGNEIIEHSKCFPAFFLIIPLILAAMFSGGMFKDQRSVAAVATKAVILSVGFYGICTLKDKLEV
jgi:hypothetical protein